MPMRTSERGMNGWLIVAIIAGGVGALLVLVFAFALVIIAAGFAAIRDGVFEPIEPTNERTDG